MCMRVCTSFPAIGVLASGYFEFLGVLCTSVTRDSALPSARNSPGAHAQDFGPNAASGGRFCGIYPALRSGMGRHRLSLKNHTMTQVGALSFVLQIRAAYQAIAAVWLFWGSWRQGSP